MKLWWLSNLLWLLLFIAVSHYFLTVKTDWTGASQTFESHIMIYIALGIVFLVILLFQLVIGYFLARRKRKAQPEEEE